MSVLVWLKSKTVITSGVAFLTALLTAAGAVDTETGLKLEGLLLPLLFVFLRMSNPEPGTQGR